MSILTIHDLRKVDAMSPAEAGQIELEEPDWRERFAAHCARWPHDPCATEWGYEATLRDWRRFNGSLVWIDGQQRSQPAPAIDGMAALAKLRIFPPRRLLQETSRDGQTGYQHDDHLWIQISGEQWRIAGIEDNILMLKGMFGEGERQIDLNKAKWGAYIAAASALIEARLEAERGPP